MFLWSIALAQEATQPKPSPFEMFLPFIFIIVIFYFLLIRPQAKKQRKHQEFLNGLKRGDSVITAGGMLGTIEGITDKYVTLEIADDVCIKILKTQIVSPAQEGQ